MDILKKIKSLHFPLGEYVVIGSGTMAVLGIREASDVDISVTKRLHSTLRSTGEWEEEIRYGKVFLKKDNIEINPALNWDTYQTTTEKAINSALIVDGVPFLNLEELKKFKTALGREKDLVDVALIDQYLSKKDLENL